MRKETITTCVDRVTDLSRQYVAAMIPAPVSVKIELTSRCDLKCFFCATSQRLRPIGDMDFGFLMKILPELKDAGVKEIGLFYLGESLLYPQLANAIRLAKGAGFGYVFLTTNGRLLDENKTREIMKAGLDSLKFSFNFPNRQQYKEFTGIAGFDTVVENIRIARRIRDENGYTCGIYASSIWYDDRQPERMKAAIDMIKDSVDEHYWLPFYNQAGYIDTMGATPGNQGRIGALRDPMPCWCLFKEGHITWDGILTGCCFAHSKEWDFGDLNEIGFMQAWNSEKAQEFRLAHLNKDVKGTACERCIG